MTFPKTEGHFQNQRSADRSPTEDEASRERETDRRSRKISASEVGQQGGVARRCSKAASQGQTMPGRASQEKKSLRRRSASRSDVAAGRRKGQATSQGQATQGRASQGSSLLSRTRSDTMLNGKRGRGRSKGRRRSRVRQKPMKFRLGFDVTLHA